jgi:hypothetical protein
VTEEQPRSLGWAQSRPGTVCDRAGDGIVKEGSTMIRTKPWPVFLAGVCLVACAGGKVDERSGTAGTAGGDRKALYSIADPCGGLTDSEAAALLGIPVGDVEKKALGEMMDNACSLRSSTERRKTVTFTLHRESSIAAAQAGLDRFAGNLGVTVPAERLAGLGEDAAWFGRKEPVVLDRLLVRKGNVWLDVSAAAGLDGSRRVAEAVLAKLE